MAPVPIFISYRRDIDSARAGIVHTIIENTFNRQGVDRVAVFRDTRGRLGVSWPTEVRTHLAGTEIVLVIIGPEWLAVTDPFGRRRLDQPDDWVRQEIEMALGGDRIVIPVAFHCDMPTADALDPSIRGLADRNGVVVRDEYWDDDLQPLLREIERHLEGGSTSVPVAGRAGELPYPDPPLPVTPAPMSDDDVRRALVEMLPRWTVVESPLPEDPARTRVELHRTFRLRSFGEALAFMRDVGDFCDNANHHPRWENVYRTVWVYLTTWDIGHRVSHLDVLLARHFDNVLARYEDGRDESLRHSST